MPKIEGLGQIRSSAPKSNILLSDPSIHPEAARLYFRDANSASSRNRTQQSSIHEDGANVLRCDITCSLILGINPRQRSCLAR